MVGSARPDHAWRLAAAHRVADAYPNERPAVIAVAGSVGAGLADRWSDLELDCYWRQPPTDADRRAPIDRLRAEVSGFWDYEADEQEWSEDYRLGALDVTISNFTVATVDELITAVVERHDTDPVKHMRLAAIERCQVLRGADIVREWRRRAARYPDQLVTAMVEQALAEHVLTGWAAREALVQRGDRIAVHALLCSIEQAVFDTVLALNRVYRPHRVAKWQCAVIDGLQIVPDGLATRLDALWQGHAWPGSATPTLC